MLRHQPSVTHLFKNVCCSNSQIMLLTICLLDVHVLGDHYPGDAAPLIGRLTAAGETCFVDQAWIVVTGTPLLPELPAIAAGAELATRLSKHARTL
jgi:hypothetical protein